MKIKSTSTVRSYRQFYNKIEVYDNLSNVESVCDIYRSLECMKGEHIVRVLDKVTELTNVVLSKVISYNCGEHTITMIVTKASLSYGLGGAHGVQQLGPVVNIEHLTLSELNNPIIVAKTPNPVRPHIFNTKQVKQIEAIQKELADNDKTYLRLIKELDDLKSYVRYLIAAVQPGIDYYTYILLVSVLENCNGNLIELKKFRSKHITKVQPCESAIHNKIDPASLVNILINR